MLPPCFDIEEMSSDVNDIASAVDESGSAVIFKKGMPVYQITKHKRSQVNTEDSTAICDIVRSIVAEWKQHLEFVGSRLSNLLLRLALRGVEMDCYTDELRDLDELTEADAPDCSAISKWILQHLKK